MKIVKIFIFTFLINIGAFLPILLVLDIGMEIQLIRDFGWGITILFISAIVIYAMTYAQFIHK